MFSLTSSLLYFNSIEEFCAERADLLFKGGNLLS